MITYKKKYISELCLEYTFGDTISEETNNQVLRLYRHLKANVPKERFKILDIVPTYTSLAIHFDADSPLFFDENALEEIVKDLHKINIDLSSQLHKIYVDYNGDDVKHVCEELQINKKELVEMHANKTYTIAMIGFRPYFPYLLGLDEKLKLPRRDDPRKLVKKGSVAIASNQTGIYSEDSPGGWHIIGNTDFKNYSALKAGDKIIFKELANAN